MQDDDGSRLDDVGYQIAVPKEVGHELRDRPKHGDDRQREGEGDEQCHLVVPVELIDNHDSVDIAEGDEAEREDTQGIVRLGYQVRVVGTEELRYRIRPYPYVQAGNCHHHRDETERLAQHQTESLVVALSHLDRPQRLDCAADTRQEEIVDLQQVQA